MNVATVFEEKIVLFTASAKILQHEGSILPSSFYGQLWYIQVASQIAEQLKT